MLRAQDKPIPAAADQLLKTPGGSFEQLIN
jgi:hypothetical protein